MYFDTLTVFAVNKQHYGLHSGARTLQLAMYASNTTSRVIRDRVLPVSASIAQRTRIAHTSFLRHTYMS
jgi:hypothetical protein